MQDDGNEGVEDRFLIKKRPKMPFDTGKRVLMQNFLSSDLSSNELVMPQYFFDVSDAEGLHRDEFGSECADFEDARQQCQGLLPDIVREELPDGELHIVVCEVRDQSGQVVYRGKITFEGIRF